MATHTITIPDFGSTAQVTVIEILVKPGDALTEGTEVITLESDKATMAVPSPASGIVKDITVQLGQAVSKGAAVLTLETEGPSQTTDADQPTATPLDSTPNAPFQSIPLSAPTDRTTRPVSAAPSSSSSISSSPNGGVHASPLVRRLAREQGIDLNNIIGSGPKQRILPEDITQTATIANTGTELPAIDFTQFGDIEYCPLSRIKKTAGTFLARNWTMIPHVTQFDEADITDLEEFRQSQKTKYEKQSIRLTVLVFIMKAVAAALRTFPLFNASLDPRSHQLILKKYCHIGIAVETSEGLVVPVIRDVPHKTILELAQELAVVSDQARNKKLLPQQMQGGCFSISSLGGIGGTAFTPIVNFPEVAILGISKAQYKPIYRNTTFVPRLMLPLSLSYDHRVIDGADGARFITHLSELLADVRTLLL